MRRQRAIVTIALALLAAAGALTPALASSRSCVLAGLLGCQPPAPVPAPTAPPAPAPDPPLHIGLTEGDPRLLVAEGGAWRAAAKAIALKPAYVRVLVPWERLQPQRGRAPNWDAPPGGCPRTAPRCRTDRGLRSLLRAIRRRQEADGGWRILAVPYFTPAWAASKPFGCQAPRYRNPRSQLPRIAPYRTFLRELNALADQVGVRIAYLTPWNEPNHPAFLQPQRLRCDRRSKALAPLAYSRLARAAAQELRDDQTLVLGSLAGLERPRPTGASAAEFVRGLPRDVACLPGPFVQHAYIGRPGRGGREPRRANPASAASRGLLAGVLAALDAKRCPAEKRLWIGETGTFDHRCEAMSAALRSWARDERVDAAFQYTFRESRAYPVGLISPSLRDTYRSYRAWYAFAGGPATVPPDPCRG